MSRANKGVMSGDIVSKLFGSILLKDTFSVNENAPLATPRGCEAGTLSLIDSGNFLSIASNNLLASGGSGTNGNPSALSQPLVRSLGLALTGYLNIADATNEVEIGFDDANAAGVLSSDALRISADTIKIYSVGAAGATLPIIPQDNTLLGYGVILRPNGAFYLIHDGANWRLLGWNYGVHDNINYIRGGFANKNAAISLSNLLIHWPEIITPLVSDRFNRADGALGSSDGYVTQEGGGDGIAWTGSTWSIASGKAFVTPTTGLEKLTDGGLEANYTAGKCDTLTIKTGSPTLVESADADTGVKAQRFTAAAQWDDVKFANFTPVANTWYRLSMRAKRTAGSSGKTHTGFTQLISGGITKAITSATFQTIRFSFLSPSTNAINVYGAQERGTSGFDTVIVDTFSLKPITFSSLLASPAISTADTCGEIQIFMPNEAGFHAGVAINIDNIANPQNYILLIYGQDAATVKIYEVKAGVYTQKLTGAVSFAANAQSGCVLSWVKTGTTVAIYMNGVQVGSTVTGLDATVAAGTNAAMFSDDESILLKNFVLYNVVQGDITTPQTLEKKNLVVFDGDSTSANGNQPIWENKYPTACWRLLGEKDWYYCNMGIGGQTLGGDNGIVAVSPTRIDTLKGLYGKKNIYVLWAGTNDITSGNTASGTYTLLTSRISAAKAAGWQVVVVNCLPRGTNGVLNATINAYNALIAANTSGASIVLDAHSLYPDVTNTVYFDADQIHLTAVGYAGVAALVKSAVVTL